jgi:hypothetical protein
MLYLSVDGAPNVTPDSYCPQWRRIADADLAEL